MKTIEAQAVARGDYIFNSHASHAAYRWVRVIEAPRRQGDYNRDPHRGVRHVEAPA